jgi:hypothetical protein
METELRSVRFREKPVHFTLIKKRWFIYWYVKVQNNGRETMIYGHHWEKYGPLFFLWREIISGQAATNGILIRDLLAENRNNIIGFLDHSRKNGYYKLMNIIIYRLVNSSKGYRPYKFGSYFKYMYDENLRLAKNCWDENQIIVDVADKIFSPKMEETLNKLIDVVKIDPKRIMDVLFTEAVFELGLKCNLKELYNYISRFENYIYRV